MLQDVVRQIVDDDPALELVGEVVTVADLAALWKRIEAEVVVVRVLATDVPPGVLPAGPDARIPAVLGLDPRGTRGVIIIDNISRTGLAAAIRAAAELHGQQEAS